MRQRHFRLAIQAADEGTQDAGPQGPGFLAFGDAPGLILVVIGQVQAFQKLASIGFRRGQQILRRDGLDARDEALSDIGEIDLDLRGVEADTFAVGDDALVPRLVDEGANLTEAPSQGASRVVRDFPKKGAETIATMRSTGQGQVGEERTGFLRWRQRLRRAIAFTLRAPVELDGYRAPEPLAAAVHPGRGILLGRRDARFLPVVAALFDLLEAVRWRVSEAARRLGVSTAAIGRFLAQDAEVLRIANERRRALGMRSLRRAR